MTFQHPSASQQIINSTFYQKLVDTLGNKYVID